MARQDIENGKTVGEWRGILNANFIELYEIKASKTEVLVKTNTTPYFPTTPYHPATKGYADGLDSAVRTTYDPTSVGGDAFDRSNHHGTQPASSVQQDADNRFASDAEKAIWSGKEDAIGAKGTAFNKDFGTTPGTASAGDHNHSTAYEPKNTNIQTHIGSTGNPHGVNADNVNCLAKDNATEFIPSADYHPATKKCVDDTVQVQYWFDGDGSETDFDLPAGINPGAVYNGGSLSRPGATHDYEVVDNVTYYTISFATAPANGNDVCVMGRAA